ncbi:MAG: cupredoxin domain-containing protein [Deltaproteobacteria bacterium]|nr:cupredoxin domain-containing protein [Deltaproteobacteria bacterium]MBW2150232.1 cupredoxin domain-containing protein [Deltaproteobacteria bacterium]
MRLTDKTLDKYLFLLLILIVVGLPIGIESYDRYVWQKKIPAEAAVFTLTGHTQRGWLLGEVQAHDVLSFGQMRGSVEKPVIEVSKGDLVVLKLKSSDVVHGFSLKDWGIIISDGIQPGKVVTVSFRADKVGSFTFSCNAICGDNHENMKGTLVVKA